MTAHAATGLNPYAYKLEAGTQSNYNRKMTLKYWLNAPAKTVSISLTYEEDDMNKVANYTGTTGEGKTVKTDYITMHGKINPTSLEADYNTLIMVTDNRLAAISEGGDLSGLRAYFQLSSIAAAYNMGEQAQMHMPRPTPTDVPKVEEQTEVITPASQKGKKVMYQGQMYILRDGKAYNMQGQMVGIKEDIIK